MTTYNAIINQSGTLTTITYSDLSIELVLLMLAIAVIYVLILNYGRNISPWRRFIGSTLILGAGALSLMYIPAEANGIMGYLLFITTLIYWITQLTVSIRDFNKSAKQM